MKRIMKYTAVILATLTVLAILWQFRMILLLFVLSLFAAATIRPFIDWLTTRGLPKAAAQLLLYGIGIIGLLLVFLLAGDQLIQELNRATNRAMIEYEVMHRRWQNGTDWQQAVVNALPAASTPEAVEDAELEQMLPAVMTITRSITTALGGIVLLLALSIYWSVDQHRFERLWLSLLPVQWRAYARDSWREIETAVGSYLRSQTVQSILAALFVIIGALVAGIEFPLLLTFIAGLAAFIPLFGGLGAALFAFVVGSLESYWLGVGTAVYTLIVFGGLDLFVEPRLWPRKHSFLLTILLIIPLVEALGLLGLMAAPPLAAAIEVLIRQTYQAYVGQQATAVQLHELEARYQQLRQKLAQSNEGAVTPELQNLTQRLADLLANSKEIKIA